TPSGNWDTLKITYTTADNGNALGIFETSNATCWWAITIGINMQCQVTHNYTSPPGVTAPTLAESSFVVTNYKASTGPKPTPVSNIYPAFSPAVPQVAKATPGGTSLANPRPIPVFFQDTQNQAYLADFVSKFSVPAYWNVMSQYGVGSPQIGSPVVLPMTAPTAIKEGDIASWLTTQLQTSPSTFGVVDANSYFVLYYPSGTTIQDSTGATASCAKFLGYHNFVHVSSTLNVPFAVIPDCQRGLETITTATSHELLEGSADPYQTNYKTISGDISWAAAYHDSELNDMCEDSFLNSWSVPASLGYRIATVWSNLAAGQFHNPCLPVNNLREINAYFQSVPVLPDTVSISNINNSSGVAKGVKIPVGTSRTIDVQLFSDQAMTGVWRVGAHQAGLATGATPTLNFSWDKASGQNGDVLYLTITPTVALPDGAVFEVESFYGGSRRNWVGAVSN
ncbi:MAG TPA: hypothetical protein VFW00_13045, partial [Rhodocyclaceae bacterium]|nr:hypothetical protein [Rhodocyclaceae bacterium]